MEAALAEVEAQEAQEEAAEVQPAEGFKAGKTQKAQNAGKAKEKQPMEKKVFRNILPTTLINVHPFRDLRQAWTKGNALRSLSTTLRERDENLEGPCALGCIVSLCCQRFNNIGCFMIFYCILLLSQGIIFGLVDLSIDHFQKDYHLKAIESLLISLTYDISSCLVAIFIAYYGGRGNRPRWIAVSSILIGMGSLLFSYPYITGGDYQLKTEIEDICQATKVISTCQDALPSFQSKYTSFFVFGQIVQGIAGIPLYILGITFVDDSVDRYSSGTYLGLGEASTMTGYALGIAIGAPQVQASVNSTSLNKAKLREDSTHWLWTWWIDFLLAGFIAWTTLIPLSCFPHNMPGTAKLKAEKRNQPNWPDTRLEHLEFGTSIKDLHSAVWILMKNQVFVCLALSRATEYLLIIGVSEFLPKYIENQYELTPTVATTLAGLVLLPGGAIGQLLGGVIISKLEMSCKAIMRFVMATSAITLILLVFIVFVRCETVQLAGITENYDGTGQLGNLTAPCNSQCECSSSFYSSICGRDNVEYFSPCFAGCTDAKIFDSERLYYNCACITKGLSTQDDQGDFNDAESGKCDAKCYTLPLFISFIFSTIVFAGFSGIPGIVAILRIVSEEQHSLALGVAFVILRIFGTIPGPVIFKMVGESSCTFRDTGTCGRAGSCWIYNKTKMAYLLVGICFLCKGLTIFFTAVALCIHSRPTKKNSNMLSAPDDSKRERKGRS
ncbi:solute carrier organic anion transporter family member 6A1 [Trichechus manatus latirostris]|uniref:Solute carrier organic anion transporter family member n=1 Tax=Trichechus manatus latirostris TaxID=127582 RepID=A0A2Y9DI98_TRIMA|nr:solute carrier organic anion transporter family member 6A1 [Trichechus manatus latirostris]